MDTFSLVGSVVTSKWRDNKASQLYHLVKVLLRNKDVNEKCKLHILKIYFTRILINEAKPEQQRKNEDNKMKFWEQFRTKQKRIG